MWSSAFGCIKSPDPHLQVQLCTDCEIIKFRQYDLIVHTDYVSLTSHCQSKKWLIIDFGHRFPFFPKNLYSSIFMKNLKGTTLDFVLKFQENRILYRKIDFLDKYDKIWYCSVKLIFFMFLRKNMEKVDEIDGSIVVVVGGRYWV